VTPFPEDTINQNGGVFQGPIYLQAEVPNNPAAFVTVGWVNDNLVAYLTQNGYMKAGNGVTLNSDGQILSIDSGLLV
jgi:hypothetical protein